MIERAVDVWCLSLNGTLELQNFVDLLSPAELERSALFRAAVHRQNFEVTRGALRILLGRYLAIDPRRVEFEYGPYGKPFLKSESSLRFNISHSGDMALYAMSELEVGIDIERIRPLAHLMNIAGRFFSVEETVELAGLRDDAQLQAFHRCWARKEAYIKALGVGLSLPLENFQVSLLPGEPPRVKAIRGHPGLEAEWLVTDLAVAEGYAAALAVRAPEIQLWTSDVCNSDELTSAINARVI